MKEEMPSRSDLGSAFRGYSPNNMRTRSSTSASVAGLMRPHLMTSRSLETERRASHRMEHSIFTPPSGGRTITCVGTGRIVFVTGIAITNPAGPALKPSTVKINAGLRPACSSPRVGSRSNNQISPRCGLGIIAHLPVCRPTPPIPFHIGPRLPHHSAILRRPDWCAAERSLGDKPPKLHSGQPAWRSGSPWPTWPAPCGSLDAPGSSHSAYRIIYKKVHKTQALNLGRSRLEGS